MTEDFKTSNYPHKNPL